MTNSPTAQTDPRATGEQIALLRFHAEVYPALPESEAITYVLNELERYRKAFDEPVMTVLSGEYWDIRRDELIYKVRVAAPCIPRPNTKLYAAPQPTGSTSDGD